MTRNMERPEWYQEEFYNKIRTPEEWLFEIHKRVKLNMDDLSIPCSLRLLSLEQRQKLFLEIIYYHDIENSLSQLQATPSQPIKHVTVSDTLLMAKLISNSDWYKAHPNREILENAIASIANGEKLNEKQTVALNQFYDLPWHVFHKNSSDKDWYPNKDISHLSGIPLSVDPGYAKQDISKKLNSFLTRWVGKLQDIEIHFDTWQKSKILAVFDLIMWFKIQDIEFTHISLHKLIWPKGRFSIAKDEYVNPDDDIKHSMDLMERVISRNVMRSLAIMCEARKHKE